MNCTGFWLAGFLAPIAPDPASAAPTRRVAFSEIHYHPVERPAFTPEGVPVLDLSKDVHEFIELFNPGTNSVPLAGWRLDGGLRFQFPDGTVLAPGQFLVVARHPRAVESVAAYALAPGRVLGPWQGRLGNNGDTLELRDPQNRVVETVTYSSSFPWPLAAHAGGGEVKFARGDLAPDQYRGRSLQRVSYTHPPDDPANWLASPAVAGPSPGRTNHVHRAVPLPVVIDWELTSANSSARLIRAREPVRLQVVWSSTNHLTSAEVEFFADDIDQTGETGARTPLMRVGTPSEHRTTALLPGQPDRTVVRFRIRANRGAGDEVVSPRADDPIGWHAWFVSPVRSSARPALDLFISQASRHRLATNIAQRPRRVTQPDPPGRPRESWNATEPAVFVEDGVVHDVQVRHHASRVHRAPGRGSYRLEFPRWDRPRGRAGLFVGDKPEFYIAAHGFFDVAGLPTSRLRAVDLYVNQDPALPRMEQDMMDNALLTRFHEEQQRATPGQPLESNGELYKSVGVLAGERDGPYGPGDLSRLPEMAPWWTPLERYHWTYRLENHKWRGHQPLLELVEGLWRARGDSPEQPRPDLPAVRAWLTQHFDLDATLTYLALRSWAGSFDNTTQNYFLWHRANGRWALLPWDFDFEFADHAVECSIFLGEVGITCNNRFYPGYRPNYLYDAIYKAFRVEFKERLFRLNNTLLHPETLTALGYGNFLAPGDRITMRRFAELRQPQVNRQLDLGRFLQPHRPVALHPADRSTALPGRRLEASPFGHPGAPAATHRSTTWTIVTAAGGPTPPVFRVTSTTNLTTLTVPAETLVPGTLYRWRCAYTDDSGHDSLDSLESTFIAGPAAVR